MATDIARGPSHTLDLAEQAANPAAINNVFRLFSKDDGAGNTRLYGIDPAGTVYQIGGAGAGGLPVVTTLTPAATSNTAIAAAKAATAANAYTIVGNPDVIRNLTVTTSGAGWDGGDITIIGTDYAGAALTETITPNAGAAATVAGTKMFKTVTSASKASVGASAVTVSIGYGSVVASFQGPTQDRDEVILYSAENLAFTAELALLANVTTGRVVTHLKTDSGFNAITLDGNGTESIAGATTKVISGQYDGISLRKISSTAWIPVSFITPV